MKLIKTGLPTRSARSRMTGHSLPFMTGSATHHSATMHSYMPKGNIITRFNLAPEQIQFLLTRITSGFQEFEWSQSKIYGNPDQNGYSTAQMFYISRHPYDSKGQPMKSPWKIQIVNGKGIKAQNKNGGSYMQPRSFQSEKTTAIQLTDMDLFTLLKRTDSYISNWETVIAASLINNGKRMLADQQNSQMQQTAQAPPYAA